MKKKTLFFCNECGYESGKWIGQCPACKSVGTFVEAPATKSSTVKSARNVFDVKAVSINEVKIVPASDVIFSETQLKEIQEKAKQLLEKENDTFLTSNIETDLNLIESGIREPRLYPYMALLSECAGIWDYMDHPLIIYSNKEEIEESVKKLQNETTSYIQEMVQEKKYLPRFAMWHDFHRVGKDCKVIEEDPFQDNISNIVELHLPNELLSKKLKYIHKLGKVLLCVEEKDTARIKEEIHLWAKKD